MTAVVVRADASNRIGSGHVMRCLTLADSLRERGCTIRFVSRLHQGHLCDLVEQRGFEVTRLPLPPHAVAQARPISSDWLGVPWEQDAEETRRAIESSGSRPGWLVADHYGIDERWERAMRSATRRVMVIDDLANRSHDCDLLLDQNLVARFDTRYVGRVPVTCRLLVGPRHALLPSVYAELHDRVTPRQGPVRHVLVFIGGADQDDLTGRVLEAFIALAREDVVADVVVSGNAGQAEHIRSLAASRSNIQVHSGLPTLAHLMAAADLAVGAIGTTTWERLCVGLPTIAVTIADNQRAIADELANLGLIELLGPQTGVTRSMLEQALRSHLETGLNADWSERCLATVDGRGTERVVNALLDAGPVLRARLATGDDERMILEWANDPLTRRNAFNTATILPKEHHAWFQARLADRTRCQFFIVEAEKAVPVGYVRFDLIDAAWRIDYALAPDFRGRGLGAPLLEAGLLSLGHRDLSDMVLGQVKEANRASRRIFESLGFDQQSGDGVIEYRRHL